MAHFLLLLIVSLFASLSAAIQWTNAGGNPLWEEPRNWDLLRVPTATDDVLINLANIPGDVRIGAQPAVCNSLVIGGSSLFGQTLTVGGSLTVGAGGGKIMPNGNLILNAAPDAPFTTYGPFDGTSKLTFYSGTLSGSGSFSFSFLNLTGPALKQFNSSVSVSGTLLLDPGRGSNGVVNIIGSQLTIDGTLKTADPLTISSSDGASLSVPGTLAYSAFSAGYSATIRGTADINILSVTAGTVTLNDAVTVAKASIGVGATITVIGAGTATRKFGDVNGGGNLKIQGGTNYFTTLTDVGNVDVEGGSFVLNSQPATINNLVQNGGSITGTAPLTVQTLAFGNAQVSNIPITTTTISFAGFTSLSAGSITVTETGVVGKPSQLTLSNGAQFILTASAVLSQSASFKFLPGGGSGAPIFTNNGKWTSTSDLQIVVNTNGNGIFQLATASTTSITGIQFTTGTLVQTSSSFTTVGSVFLADSISGTGTIVSQGDTFTVTNTLQASSFTQTSGSTTIGNGAIPMLDMQTGLFNITGPAPATGPLLAIGTLTYEGGNIVATGPTAPITANEVVLTGTQPKTFTSLTLNANLLTLDCDVQQCQVFTLSAHLIAGKKVLKRNL